MPQFFIDEFTIGKDVIYGRGEEINKYIKCLQKNDKINKSYSVDYVSYQKSVSNPSDFFSWMKEKHFFAINTYNYYLNNANYTKYQMHKTISTYTKEFNDTRYNTAFQEMDTEKLKKSNIGVSAQSSHKIKRAAYHDMIIRRGCKFGIAYITENNQSNVYYALDGIILGHVITKYTIKKTLKIDNLNVETQKIPICTSELRYLFRNWNRYKDKVIFMELIQESPKKVAAPWDREDQITGWASYALDRMAKTIFNSQQSLNKEITFEKKLAAFSAYINENPTQIKQALNLEAFKNNFPIKTLNVEKKKIVWDKLITHSITLRPPMPKEVITIFHKIQFSIINQAEAKETE